MYKSSVICFIALVFANFGIGQIRLVDSFDSSREWRLIASEHVEIDKFPGGFKLKILLRDIAPSDHGDLVVDDK